ncbi:MAG: hypothetical protein Q9227_003885 [Pyrenula ochraceoflavens]
MIAFVDGRVYMKCRERIFSEDPAENGPLMDLGQGLNYLTFLQERFELRILQGVENLLYMFEIVRHAQVRNLSKPIDAINAVAGLVDRIARRMSMYFLEGLPTQALDIGLLFEHSLDGKWSKRNKRRASFPSWSWAGWCGSIDWCCQIQHQGSEKRMNNFLNNYTWISWFSLNDNGLKMLQGSNKVTEARRDGLADRFPMLDKTLWKPLSRPAIYSSTLLIFYTALIRLKAVTSTTEGRPILRLFDADGKACGLIVSDLADHHLMDSLEEIILLSETTPDPELWCGFSASEALNYTREIRYWVMLVTWTGSFYERRGIGIIFHSCIARSYEPGPQWKEIVLG